MFTQEIATEHHVTDRAKAEDLVQVTLNALKCRKCWDVSTQWPERKRPDLGRDWAPPCGWAGTLTPGRKELVIVALNPGGPIDGAEDWRTIGFEKNSETVKEEHAREMNRRCLHQYQHPGSGQDFVFHKKSVALARALLWLRDDADPADGLWERCWFTDAFKCPTKKELAPRIPKAAFEACRTHLDAELRACDPLLVVALGNRAFRALSYKHEYPVVGFRHPSNGCPKLQSSAHHRGFAQAASALGASSRYDQHRFLDVRRALQAHYFGASSKGLVACARPLPLR